MAPVTPIRIAHLITDLDVGGAEMMLTKLVAATDRERFSTKVISMLPFGPLADALADRGIHSESLGMRRGALDPRALIHLVRLLRRNQVQILQTWLYHADLLGLIAARLAGVPSVVWNLRCSDMDVSRYSHLRRLLALLSRRPDVVVVNSAAGQSAHSRFGYRPRRWEMIPNGFDIECFRIDPDAPQRLRASLRLPEDSFLVTVPARFDPMKDHATFLAAAKLFARRHANAYFVLLGRGIERNNLILWEMVSATRYAERIVLLGERSDVQAILAGSDVVTLSSAFGEGCPNVVGEAMACGVPVVATDVGDAAQLIGPTGIVVPPRDASALAAAWDALLRRGSLGRAGLGWAARQRIVRDYALRSIVDRYERLYESLADRSVHPHDCAICPPIS
jgi:glycosyltransferase involved in cell wall biosynthesis